jgi:hypothetical protein
VRVGRVQNVVINQEIVSQECQLKRASGAARIDPDGGLTLYFKFLNNPSTVLRAY